MTDHQLDCPSGLSDWNAKVVRANGQSHKTAKLECKTSKLDCQDGLPVLSAKLDCQTGLSNWTVKTGLSN